MNHDVYFRNAYSFNLYSMCARLMQIFDNEIVVTFDVDDTLIMWPENNKHLNASSAQPSDGSIEIPAGYGTGTFHLIPNKRHIDLLKNMKARGHVIIVWSAGGVRHAESVVKALQLESYVDIVLTKPCKYVDDLQVEKWFGPRIYLK